MVQSLTTELDAVNQILRTIGEPSVTSLADSSADVQRAQELLTDVSREFQIRGWSFNTDTKVAFTADGSSEVVLPTNVARFEHMPLANGPDYVFRNGKVYDRNNKTFAVGDVTLDKVVYLLDFTELPESARRFVAARAARIMAEQTLQDRFVVSQAAIREQDAWVELLHDESRSVEANILSIYDPRVRGRLSPLDLY